MQLMKQALYLQAITAGLLKPLWNWPQDQACFSVHRDSSIFVQRLKCTYLFFFETVIVLWKPVFISLRPIHWKKLSLVSKTDSRMPKPREIIHLRKKKNIRKILNSSKLNFYYLYYILVFLWKPCFWAHTFSLTFPFAFYIVQSFRVNLFIWMPIHNCM